MRATACSIWLLFAAVAHGEDASPGSRVVSFDLAVTVQQVPAGSSVDVYVPLAQDTARQTVRRTDLNANIDGEERTESKYGNRYWHGHVDASDGGEITVQLTQIVERRSHGSATPTEDERALFLAPNLRVPIEGPLVDAARSELALAADATPMARARAIYSYVISAMAYTREGTGWGQGDTKWALTESRGDSTDFHALFASLSRAEGIPTRFEAGFPIPLKPTSGAVTETQSWIEVALPDEGWFPIDAAEARRHPAQRSAMFGAQPMDRIRFTVGRDLTLHGQQTPPLNFFVLPHVEVAGQTWDKVQTRMGYHPPKD
jgi:transglutaminase-like putative cysteine protease